MFRLSLFGGFQLQDEHGNPLEIRNRKAQLLLAYLVLHAGQDHSREKLIDLFWPDSELDKADNNLRQAIYTVRKAIEPEGTPRGTYLAARQGIVRFSAEADYWDDVSAFETLLQRAEATADEARALALKEAVELYRDDLLAGVYEDWCLDLQQTYRTRYLNALHALIDDLIADKDYATAIPYAQGSLSQDPLQEDMHRRLMVLYHAVGERTAALQQYRECERVLRDELDAEPAPETRALLEEIESRTGLDRIEDQVEHARELIHRFPDLGAPFVGREKESLKLARAWAEASEGRGQAVLIAGEAGIGKTRLAQQYLDYAATHGGLDLRGRSYELEGKSPYQPLVEALRRGLRDLPEEAIRSVSSLWLREVAKMVPELAPESAEAPHAAPLVSPEQERQRLFEGLCQFLLALSKERPVALFLDDLQWADASTLQFVAYLARRIESERVLILGTYREEELGEDHPLWARLQQLISDQGVTQVNLQPLGAEEIRALVEGMLKSEEQALLARRVFEESKGVPFFAEELLKAFMDAGVVGLDAQRQWQVAPDRLSAEHVPGTVQALIESRLPRLDESSRRLLEQAAVVSRDFTPDWMGPLVGLSEGALNDALDALLDARFLESEGVHYRFRHDLTRQVVYRRLRPERRRQLHLRTGEALEPFYAQDPEGEGSQWLGDLARHFHQAQRWERALAYGLKAGEQAWTRSYSKDEALAFFERALEAAEHLDDTTGRLRALKGLGEVCALTDEQDRGLEYCERALEDCDDPEDCADLYCAVAAVYHHKRELETGLKYCEKALKELGEESESPSLIRTCYYASNFNNWLSRPDQAIAHCERALNLLEKRSNDYWRSLILSELGHAHIRKEEYNKAIEHLQKAIQLAEQLQDQNTLRLAVFNLGLAHFNSKDINNAILHWEKALKLTQEMGNIPGDLAGIYSWLVHGFMISGEYEKSLEYAYKQLENNKLANRPLMIGSSYARIGCLYDTIGDSKMAKKAFSQAFDQIHQSGRLYHTIIVSYLFLDRRDKAIDWFKRGRSHLEKRRFEHLANYPALTPSFEQFQQSPEFRAFLAEELES